MPCFKCMKYQRMVANTGPLQIYTFFDTSATIEKSLKVTVNVFLVKISVF